MTKLIIYPCFLYLQQWMDMTEKGTDVTEKDTDVTEHSLDLAEKDLDLTEYPEGKICLHPLDLLMTCYDDPLRDPHSLPGNIITVQT
jgi:hypothetical protein